MRKYTLVSYDIRPNAKLLYQFELPDNAIVVTGQMVEYANRGWVFKIYYLIPVEEEKEENYANGSRDKKEAQGDGQQARSSSHLERD